MPLLRVELHYANEKLWFLRNTTAVADRPVVAAASFAVGAAMPPRQSRGYFGHPFSQSKYFFARTIFRSNDIAIIRRPQGGYRDSELSRNLRFLPFHP